MILWWGCGKIVGAKIKILINKAYCDYIFYDRGVWAVFYKVREKVKILDIRPI